MTFSDVTNILINLMLIAFVGIILYTFLKSIIKVDTNDLIMEHKSGFVSHSKFWSNIAYLVATICFIVLNLFHTAEILPYIEFLWLIFLGTVASNAAVNKLITYKYGNTSQVQSQPQNQDNIEVEPAPDDEEEPSPKKHTKKR